MYGTEAVFVDGDDTPWSKAFLASAYASRGIKVRFTSGGGSEALMGESEGKSMLYLEARCLSLVRAAGSQGVQNGSISCIALALSVPGGTREVLAENVLAAWLDLEVASGNDAIASHSEIRKTAKLMGQFLPGTDFVTSGYSSMPRYDNMFGGGNYDSHDLDEWLTMQRDWQVDAGIEPLGEAARSRCASVAREPSRRSSTSSGSRRSATRRCGSPRPASTRATCPTAIALPTWSRATACSPRGSAGSTSPGRSNGAASRTSPPASSGCSVSASPPTICRPRRSSTPTAPSVSAVNDANRLPGPGTGYRLEGERWERLQRLPLRDRRAAARRRRAGAAPPSRRSGRPASAAAPDEVVIAVGPAFGGALGETINGLSHAEVLGALLEGVRERGRQSEDRARAAHAPTWRSSGMTAPCSRDRGSRSASSRKGRR